MSVRGVYCVSTTMERLHEQIPNVNNCWFGWTRIFCCSCCFFFAFCDCQSHKFDRFQTTKMPPLKRSEKNIARPFHERSILFSTPEIHHAYVSSSGRHALTLFFLRVIFHRCRRRRNRHKHDRILLAARDFLFSFRFVYYYLQFELVLQWLNTSAAWLSARPAIFIFCWNVYSLWTHFFRCQFSIIHIDLSAQCTASPMWSIFSFTLRHIHLGHSILLFKVQQCKDYVVGIRIFAFIHSFIFVHCKRNYSCFSVPRHGYRFSHPPSSHHLRAFT